MAEALQSLAANMGSMSAEERQAAAEQAQDLFEGGAGKAMNEAPIED